MPGYRKLGRVSAHRMMMLRNLTTELIRHGSLITTDAKAKELQKSVQKMITLAKRGDLHARRQVAGYLTDDEVVKTLFEQVGPNFQDRNGGYTRIYKLGPRQGDGALLAKIELV
ncbi:50S ribosomal protein L17 [Guggenheimella bovis]